MCALCGNYLCEVDTLVLEASTTATAIVDEAGTVSDDVWTSLESLVTEYTWPASIITYSFPTSGSEYSASDTEYDEEQSFLSLSNYGEDMVRAAFAEVSASISVSLVESSDGDIRVAGSSVVSTAWAYLPTSGSDGDGDIWVGVEQSYNSLFTATTETAYLGSYEYYVSMHETGHALGLKHPHVAYGSNNETMSTSLDAVEYSVMSYRSYLGSGTSGLTITSGHYPQSLMILDIAALQTLYGADYTVNSGDTVYSFSPSSGDMLVNGVSSGETAANVVFRTLWDGGGTDTIDLSAYSTSLSVDLNDGASIILDTDGTTQRANLGTDYSNGESDVKYAGANIYMSLLYQDDVASLIENATGGSGDDEMIGNELSNALIGGAGDDTLSGRAGADTLTLGAGADLVSDTLANLAGDVITDFDVSEDVLLIEGSSLSLSDLSFDSISNTLTIGAAVITLTGIDAQNMAVATTSNGSVITFSDAASTAFSGDDGTDDTVVADDPVSINGSGGDDIIEGGSGDDSFLLRYGSDTVTGNAGADTFNIDWRYAWDNDSHTITDLDFSEGDVVSVRFFDTSQRLLISDLSSLAALDTRDDVTVSETDDGWSLSFTDDAGMTVMLALETSEDDVVDYTDETTNGTDETTDDTGETTVDDTDTTPLSFTGSGSDDTMQGGAGDDSFLFRYGSDTGTGDAGSDTFLVDWRYVWENDSHTVTDLNFEEGDLFRLRFFSSSQLVITDQSSLETIIARDDVTATAVDDGTMLTFTDDDGLSLDLTLVGITVDASLLAISGVDDLLF